MQRTFHLPSTRKEQEHKEMTYHPVFPDSKKGFIFTFQRGYRMAECKAQTWNLVILLQSTSVNDIRIYKMCQILINVYK